MFKQRSGTNCKKANHKFLLCAGSYTSDRYVSSIIHSYQVSLEQGLIREITLSNQNEACLYENGAWDCTDTDSEESNQFTYTADNLIGFEHESSSFTLPISANFESGRLLTVLEQFQNREHFTDYSYEGDRVVKIEAGLSGIDNITWEKTLHYEGGNLTKMEVDLPGLQAREEWSFTYDDQVNPFYQKTEWLLTLKLGLDKWFQSFPAGEALVFSENNVSAVTFRRTQAFGGESFDTYTFNRTYDDEGYPVETSITKNNGPNPRLVQLISYEQ